MTHIVLILLAVILVALGGGDWWTTRTGILSGKAAEGNPIAKWLIAKLGLDGALIGKWVLITLLAAHAVQMGPLAPVKTLVTLGGLDVLFAFVVYRNWRIISA